MKQIYSKMLLLIAMILVGGSAWADSWTICSISDLTSSDVFVIVDANTGKAMTNNNGTSSAPTATAVTISQDGNTITDVTDAMKWNISGNGTDGYTFYPNGSTTTWLYCTNTNNGMRVGTNDAKTFVIENHTNDEPFLKHSGTSRYIGVYNSQDWRCYTSVNTNINATKTRFYKYTSGGSSTPEPTKYDIIIANDIANGSVTATPTSAAEKATVTLTATPASGYELVSWNVTNASTKDAIEVKDNKFTMPAANVNVSATFNKIQDKTIAEFIASEGGKCYLTGVVSNIAANNYGNFDLTDETGTIYVYGCLTPAGEKQKFNTLDVVAGDKIKVLAETYELYNKKHEAMNVIFVEEIAIEKAKNVVTITTPENGTILVKNGENIVGNGDEVEEGTTLTLTAVPADQYKFAAWSVTDAESNAIVVSNNTFSMPASAVTVSASFEEIPPMGEAVTVTYNFNDKNSFPADFPTATGTSADAKTFEISDNPIIINAANYYIINRTTENCGLFLGKTSTLNGIPQNGTAYLGFPAKSGYKLIKVTATTTSGAAAGVPINIYDKNWTEMSTNIKTESSTKKEMEFVIADSKENTSYRLTGGGTSGKNLQFDNIVLTYEKCEAPASYSLTISSVSYATFYDSKNAYVMPEDCEGYVFTVEKGLELAYKADETVPAGEPLVIYTIEPGTKELVYTTSTEETYKSGDMNDLEGTDEQTALEADDASYFYALSLDKNGENVGFYWMNATGAAFTNGAHKAYLKAAKTATSAKVFTFDKATAIKTIATATDAKIFDLTGREVKTPKAGIYVVNGVKKYIK